MCVFLSGSYMFRNSESTHKHPALTVSGKGLRTRIYRLYRNVSYILLVDSVHILSKKEPTSKRGGRGTHATQRYRIWHATANRLSHGTRVLRPGREQAAEEQWLMKSPVSSTRGTQAPTGHTSASVRHRFRSFSMRNCHIQWRSGFGINRKLRFFNSCD